jgi:hypothetical protein
MELVNCPNCFTVYAEVQDACPNCDADADGAGGRVQLDSAARTVVARLGGLFGGILEAGDGAHLFWCARGVCLWSEEVGLVWHRATAGRVEDVAVRPDGVRVSTGRRVAVLSLADGEPVG